MHENVFMLAVFLATHGVDNEDIKDIYVLGHSMSPPDLEYFTFLMDSTRTHDPIEAKDEPETLDDFDPMLELQDRINYAIEHYGYQHVNEHIDPSQNLAMARRLKLEQDANQEWMEKEFFRVMGIRHGQRKTKSDMMPSPSKLRTKDAMWYLSYHGDSDKAWKETVLHELGCRQYELLPTIDACLEKFRICQN